MSDICVKYMTNIDTYNRNPLLFNIFNTMSSLNYVSLWNMILKTFILILMTINRHVRNLPYISDKLNKMKRSIVSIVKERISQIGEGDLFTISDFADFNFQLLFDE